MCSTTLELTHVLTIESSKALLELHKPENISRWSTDANLVNAFWTIGSSVTIALANVLIEHKDLTSTQVQSLLAHLESILRSRNEFLQQANLVCVTTSEVVMAMQII
jgi:predicted RNA-binding Zn ribbon-like protein